MYSIKKMVQPDNFDEAWELLQKSPRNVILGGGLFLKLGEKSINKAVDLTHLGLDFIEKVDDSIRIGSMVSFGRLEEHKLLNDETGGIIRKSLVHYNSIRFFRFSARSSSFKPYFIFL